MNQIGEVYKICNRQSLFVTREGQTLSCLNHEPAFEERANIDRVAFMVGAASADELIVWADDDIELTT